MAITTEQLVDEQTVYISSAKKALNDKDLGPCFTSSTEQTINKIYEQTKIIPIRKTKVLTNDCDCSMDECKLKVKTKISPSQKNETVNKNLIDAKLLDQVNEQSQTILNQHVDPSSNRVPKNSYASMRVLIFSESFYPYTSGIARRFIEVVTRLAMHGFKVHVVTGTDQASGWINDDVLKENITFGILKSTNFKNRIDCTLPFLFPQYGILSEIRKFKPDVIHVVEHTPAALMCIAIAKILDIPLVCSSHTHVDNYIPLYIRGFAVNMSLSVYRLVRREFLSMANANLTVSSDFMQMLECSGVKGKIHVWKTGVDSELFNPKYRSQKTRLEMFNGHYSPDKVLLVSVGRISPEKNFEFLLKILENCPETFLCIVGDGPYRKTIESSFPKHRTHFTGFLQGEKLASAYASADYFIYASVSETFGQVYLEAMSSGLPVVAAEGKQMKEFFQNLEHGNTWTPDCVDSAVKALRITMNDHDRLARNCRATALKRSWDGSAEQIMQIYSNYIGHKQDKRPINMALRTVYYTIKYLILMLLVGLFMAPFVTRPTSLVNNQTQKSKKSNSNHQQQQQQDVTTLMPMTTNNFLTIFYAKFSSKLHEPNRVCAFLATLSALFLSLIVYMHHYLY